ALATPPGDVDRRVRGRRRPPGRRGGRRGRGGAMNPGEPRHIDTASGALEGEAARMRVDRAGWSGPARLPAPRVPLTRAEEEAPTYYGLPVVKAPPWLGYVPAYFYAGGV